MTVFAPGDGRGRGAWAIGNAAGWYLALMPVALRLLSHVAVALGWRLGIALAAGYIVLVGIVVRDDRRWLRGADPAGVLSAWRLLFPPSYLRARADRPHGSTPAFWVSVVACAAVGVFMALLACIQAIAEGL